MSAQPLVMKTHRTKQEQAQRNGQNIWRENFWRRVSAGRAGADALQPITDR